MTGPGTNPARTPTRPLAISLTIAGVLTLIVGIVLGATVEPLLYVVALSAVIDFALAYGYATGRLGAADQARRDTEVANEQAMLAEDPSLNPYARED
jgi:hypothetical protein